MNENEQTRIARLRLDNDPGWTPWIEQQADECLEEYDGDANAAANELADRLIDTFGPQMFRVSSRYPSLHAELLSDAVSEIDWYAVAEGFIEEAA